MKLIYKLFLALGFTLAASGCGEGPFEAIEYQNNLERTGYSKKTITAEGKEKLIPYTTDGNGDEVKKIRLELNTPIDQELARSIKEVRVKPKNNKGQDDNKNPTYLLVTFQLDSTSKFLAKTLDFKISIDSTWRTSPQGTTLSKKHPQFKLKYSCKTNECMNMQLRLVYLELDSKQRQTIHPQGDQTKLTHDSEAKPKKLGEAAVLYRKRVVNFNYQLSKDTKSEHPDLDATLQKIRSIPKSVTRTTFVVVNGRSTTEIESEEKGTDKQPILSIHTDLLATEDGSHKVKSMHLNGLKKKTVQGKLIGNNPTQSRVAFDAILLPIIDPDLQKNKAEPDPEKSLHIQLFFDDKQEDNWRVKVDGHVDCSAKDIYDDLTPFIAANLNTGGMAKAIECKIQKYRNHPKVKEQMAILLEKNRLDNFFYYMKPYRSNIEKLYQWIDTPPLAIYHYIFESNFLQTPQYEANICATVDNPTENTACGPGQIKRLTTEGMIKNNRLRFEVFPAIIINKDGKKKATLNENDHRLYFGSSALISGFYYRHLYQYVKHDPALLTLAYYQGEGGVSILSFRAGCVTAAIEQKNKIILASYYQNEKEECQRQFNPDQMQVRLREIQRYPNATLDEIYRYHMAKKQVIDYAFNILATNFIANRKAQYDFDIPKQKDHTTLKAPAMFPKDPSTGQPMTLKQYQSYVK